MPWETTQAKKAVDMIKWLAVHIELDCQSVEMPVSIIRTVLHLYALTSTPKKKKKKKRKGQYVLSTRNNTSLDMYLLHTCAPYGVPLSKDQRCLAVESDMLLP